MRFLERFKARFGQVKVKNYRSKGRLLTLSTFQAPPSFTSPMVSVASQPDCVPLGTTS
jgi:hypothetical protein